MRNFYILVGLVLMANLSQAAGLSNKLERQVISASTTEHGLTETQNNLAFKKRGGKLQAALLKVVERKLFRKLAAADDAEVKSASTMGLLSLIFAAAGLVLMFIPVIGIASLLLLPAAVILGIIGLKRAKKSSDPRAAGMVTSILGLVFGSIGILLLLLAIAYWAAWTL